MRIVDRPVMAPMHCAAIPFLGQTAENVRWVDTGVELTGWDGRVYLSDVAVRQCMELFGYDGPLAVEVLRAELEATQAELAVARAERERLQATLDAVDTLESADYRRRHKPGRPPKARVAA